MKAWMRTLDEIENMQKENAHPSEPSNHRTGVRTVNVSQVVLFALQEELEL